MRGCPGLRPGVVRVGGPFEQPAFDEGRDVPAHRRQVEVELLGEVRGSDGLQSPDVGEDRDRDPVDGFVERAP